MGICKRCKDAVRWGTTTKNQKPMPLNPEPNAAGNVVIEHTDPNGKEWLRVLTKAELEEPAIGARFVPHIATCGKPKT